MQKLRGILGVMLLLVLGTGVVHAADWIETWGTAPMPPSQAMGPFPGTPSFSNQTLRQTIRVSAGGGEIRIRFTNEYGTRPLVIGAARVALVDDKGRMQAQKAVKFSGSPTATIPPGAPLLSDPIDLSVKPLGQLSISLFLPQDTGPCTCHQPSLASLQVSDTGDLSDQPFTPKLTLQTWAFISGVLVEASRSARTVVMLGDSITDGIGSTVDANHRWPDLLAERISTARHPWGVVNMGISGNQVLADGAGQSALVRFDRDVLSVPGVRTVILFEGVNDLGIAYGRTAFKMASTGPAAPKPTADALIAAYRQLIDRAHLRGIRVVGATITPYEGASYYSEEGEAVRQEINRWVRTTRELDGVIDFDALLRDPDKPTQIKAAFTSDHLHGSDAGYAAMAAAVDLGVLD